MDAASTTAECMEAYKALLEAMEAYRRDNASAEHPYDGSKRDYQDKQTGKFVGLRSGLFLNESIADMEHGELLASKQTWTADDIRRRNDLLADLVVALYKLK